MIPKFITPLEDPIYLFRGMTMTVKCNVFGGPTPAVTWFKDGKSLKNQARFTQPDYRLLQIRNIRDSDEGVYRCMAENIYGKIDSTGNVKVLGNNFMKEILILGIFYVVFGWWPHHSGKFGSKRNMHIN